MTKKNNLIIIGVGNPMRSDDGIGPKIIELLRQHKNLNCDLLDAGTDGLALLDVLQNYQRAIIIDAVNMGAAVGTLRMFSPCEAIIEIRSDTLSTHGFGLAEVIKLMEQLGIKTELTIVGIQPGNIDYGDKLSNEVAAKISDILESCLGAIQNPTDYGI
jgi:hydrogenase maturation protease